MWFERKTDDVLNATVASVGGVACESPTKALSTSPTSFPVVTVYDDEHQHEALPEYSPLDHIPMITDAMFATKEPLQYPSIAQDEDISGTVVVGVVIGPDGKSRYAWVRARAVSAGGGTMLDGPSLWAALNSTYKPKREDGQPTSSVYSIVYEFRLDNGINLQPRKDARSDAPIDYAKCPAILQTLRVSVSDKTDQTQWYSLGVDAKGTNLPTSVIIGVRDAQHKSSGLVWEPIPLHQDSGSPKWWSAVGSFNWKGPPITLAWVDQATLGSGEVVTCPPISDAPFNLAEGTELPRYIAGDPLPLLSMQQVQPAQFTHEVWPQYPLGRNGARDAGYAVVQTVVDETGTIREAFLIQASGVRALDSAALYAATSSDYRPAGPGAVALYEAVYQFVP